MPSFSELAWQRTGSLRAAIHALPFNVELAAGTLGPARFRRYITQDAIFLVEYSRALALAGARAPDGRFGHFFIESALEAVAVEQALHARYFGEFGVSPADAAAAQPAPDCLAYTSFLLATAYHDRWEVLVAALLPCFWLYWDVGSAIVTRAGLDNPFRAWIETYADAAYGETVKQVIAIADDAAAAGTAGTQAHMLTAFVRSCQFEWLFWDGAYQQREWPALG